MADEKLRDAFRWASGIVHNVKADQLDDPTRCEGWTVGMLMTHMIGAAQAFAAGVPVGDVSPQVDVTIDLCGGDWGATYDAAWPGVLEAWADADPDGSTDFPWGPTPNVIARRLLLMESAIHGSDLAKARTRGYRTTWRGRPRTSVPSSTATRPSAPGSSRRRSRSRRTHRPLTRLSRSSVVSPERRPRRMRTAPAETAENQCAAPSAST